MYSVHLLHYYHYCGCKTARESWTSVGNLLRFFFSCTNTSFFSRNNNNYCYTYSFIFIYTGIIIRTRWRARELAYYTIHIIFYTHDSMWYDDNDNVDDGNGGGGCERKKNQQCIILCIHVEYLNIKRRTYYIIIVFGFKRTHDVTV